MKQVRSALLVFISLVLFSACFNPPEFDPAPQVKYEGVYFGKAPNGSDSLVISVSFKDGDGDLGFGTTREHIDSPYNEINFYANDDGSPYAIPGDLIPSFRGYRLQNAGKTPAVSKYYINTPGKPVAELLTLASRNQGFSLPPFVRPYDCSANKESYLNDRLNADTIYIWKADSALIKDKSTIIDRLVRIDNQQEWYFAVRDFFYIRQNPRHYNFKVEFYVMNDQGTFEEYDFRAEFCETHDGRFPLLADKERALEGTINYSMVSCCFQQIFSIKTLKLAITVYDRAGNESNRIETPPFRLEEI